MMTSTVAGSTVATVTSGRQPEWFEDQRGVPEQQSKYLLKLRSLREGLIRQEQANLNNALGRIQRQNYAGKHNAKPFYNRKPLPHAQSTPFHRKAPHLERLKRIREMKPPPRLEPLQGQPMLSSTVPTKTGVSTSNKTPREDDDVDILMESWKKRYLSEPGAKIGPSQLQALLHPTHSIPNVGRRAIGSPKDLSLSFSREDSFTKQKPLNRPPRYARRSVTSQQSNEHINLEPDVASYQLPIVQATPPDHVMHVLEQMARAQTVSGALKPPPTTPWLDGQYDYDPDVMTHLTSSMAQLPAEVPYEQDFPVENVETKTEDVAPENIPQDPPADNVFITQDTTEVSQTVSRDPKTSDSSVSEKKVETPEKKVSSKESKRSSHRSNSNHQTPAAVSSRGSNNSQLDVLKGSADDSESGSASPRRQIVVQMPEMPAAHAGKEEISEAA
ncbi:uncharacterized protein [Branchiostoma lanceolatum]|uniref:uncharacterized protein n=1 Tax=Branchiostoma lanceolatum TaxID=7740 RepID=UPI003455E965